MSILVPVLCTLGAGVIGWVVRGCFYERIDVDELASVICHARNEWAEQHEAQWLEDHPESVHPDDYIAESVKLYLEGPDDR